ncbi:hypothetical protein T12_14299 [Trichinella patagoniensis]|uniref:Uncharacterized protein n=1 Tax=Trichinella patagoniensis TaxID=990121 RepID=A0A0V0ZXM6_9BILA|nr:hypothetical protein T12_14299 [Trichinella patagoniensis]
MFWDLENLNVENLKSLAVGSKLTLSIQRLACDAFAVVGGLSALHMRLWLRAVLAFQIDSQYSWLSFQTQQLPVEDVRHTSCRRFVVLKRRQNNGTAAASPQSFHSRGGAFPGSAVRF